MSPSFVVTLHEDEQGNLLGSLSQADPNFQGADILRNLVIDPAQIPPNPRIDTRQKASSYGRGIREALLKHPAIGKAIEAVYMAQPREPARLMFEIKGPAAECLRWETLCDDNDRFAAIEAKCRIGRVASNAGALDAAVRTFSWPLRMTAFLSAAGISAGPELEKILAAVGAVRAKRLDIECRIYLGEQELLDKLQAEIDADERPGISALPMPDTPAKIETILAEDAPQLLHFFCHGISSTGVQSLEFATINDWDSGNTNGSSLLSIDRIVGLEAIKHCWLTVLNCCEGAGALEQTNSMAYQIVVLGGCPTAVGMSEPIAAGDATAVSQAFYTSLFALLKNELAEAGAFRRLDLTPAIVAARMALHDLYQNQPPEAFGRWSLPVLYVAAKGLEVQVPLQQQAAADDLMQKRIDLVAQYLRDMPSDTPEELRDRVLAMLDQPPKVPAHLRPDRFGSFDRE